MYNCYQHALFLEGSFIRGERLRKIRGLRIYFVDRDKILRLAPLVRHSFGYFPAAVGRKVTSAPARNEHQSAVSFISGGRGRPPLRCVNFVCLLRQESDTVPSHLLFRAVEDVRPYEKMNTAPFLVDTPAKKCYNIKVII